MNNWINVWFDNEILLYNLKYSTGIKMKKDDFLKYTTKEIESMLENKEKKYAEKYKDSYKNEPTKLTILPTFNCNLQCEYCFEPKTSRYSNNEELKEMEFLNQIIDFIDSKLQMKNDVIIVNWYGGEPLLKFHFILKAVTALNNKFNEIKFEHYLITNGYMLNNDKIHKLKQIGFNSIHLTLDGDKEYHDSLKRTLDGQGTFDTIFDTLINASKEFNIILRINVNRYNSNSIIELLHKIASIDSKSNVTLEFRRLSSNNSNDLRYLDIKEYMEVYVNYIKACFDLDLKMIGLLSPNLNFCSALSNNNYVIEPNGNIRKCYEEVNNNDTILTNLQNTFFNNLEEKVWSEYRLNDKCISCNLLSICSGGCPRHVIRNNNPDCKYTEEGVKEILKLLYKNMSNYKERL